MSNTSETDGLKKRASSNTSDENDRENSSYRWYILIACFLTLMMTLGVARSTVIYLTVFQEYYDLSETKKVAFIVLPLVASGLCSPFIAVLCSRVQVKFVLLLFTVLGAICQLLAILQFSGVEQVNSFLALITVAGGLFGGLILAVPLEINTWFSPQQRVMATAIAFTGSSLGGLWIGPTFSKYIVNDIHEDGWEKAEVCLNATNTKNQVAIFDASLSTEESDANSNVTVAGVKPIWYDSYLYLSLTQLVFLLIASAIFFIPKPANTINYAESNKVDRPGFKVLLKYKKFIIFLISQVFYVVWRSGYLNLLVDFAEKTRCFTFTQAGLLLTIEAASEVLARPTIGRLSQNRNLYLVLGIIFALQGVLTWFQPYCMSYASFAVIVGLIGALQGGSGGLFMQAITEATNVKLARYAYSINSVIGVFVSGMATQSYGFVGDAVSEVETIGFKENYVFYLAGLSSLVASVFCVYGGLLNQQPQEDSEESKGLEPNA